MILRSRVPNVKRHLPRLALLVFLVPIGCSGPASQRIPQFTGDTVPVSGTVKLDDDPLVDANVNYSFDGKPPSDFRASAGITDSTGKYVLRSGQKTGAPPGRYKVTISKYVTPDGKPFKDDPERGIDLEQARLGGMVKQGLPARYSDPVRTELSVEITQDQKDPVNFDLKSK